MTGNYQKLLGISILATGLFVVAGCGKKDVATGTKLNTSTSPGGQSQVAESKEPVFKGKAEDILNEFKTDKAAAEKKYLNKYVEIEGVVYDYPGAGGSKEKMSLATPEKKAMAVVCDMTPEAQKKFRELGTGEKVKVQGKLYLAIIGVIYLNDCTYTEAGPNPAIKVAAKELGKEYSKDEGEPAKKKYDGKEMIVEGVVKDVKETPGGFSPTRIVQLDAGMAEPMDCQILATLGDEFKRIEKGDKVVLKGTFSNNMLALKNYPSLSNAYLVKKD